MSHRYRRGQVYWLAYYHNGKLHRGSLHTKDLATAKYLQAKKDQEISQGRSVVPDAKGLSLPVLDEYLKFNEHRRSRRVNADARARISRFLSWAGILTFAQVSEKKLQDYLNHRINEDKISLWEANNIIANLKAWLNWCTGQRRISENPLRGLKKYRIPDNPKRFLSAEEISRLLAAAATPRIYVDRKAVLYPAIAAGIYTGMRQAELFSLEWQDIDFKTDQITVRNKEGFVTKSRKFRIIPLHKKLKGILRPLRKVSGACFDVTNQRRVFGRIIRHAGLQGIGWHTLRHTFASHLVMGGADLATVSKLLGHASITTTMIYAHLSRGHIQESIQKLKF